MEDIKCHWKDGGLKTEADRLINMVHAMAGVMAANKIGGWELKLCGTMHGVVETEYTNGIVVVGAKTEAIDGSRAHFYYLKKDDA